MPGLNAKTAQWVRQKTHPGLVSIACCLLLPGCVISRAQQTNNPPVSPDAQVSPFTIEVKVNRVLMPVVVRDKQGHAVGDLKKEDFQVFANDKPQAISGFLVQKRGRAADKTDETVQRRALSNAA